MLRLASGVSRGQVSLAVLRPVNNLFGQVATVTVPLRSFASKAAASSTKNGRDSEGKRLGIKRTHGQAVKPGTIIFRQRGTKWIPGNGTGLGKDGTIYATVEGKVEFGRAEPKYRDRSKKYRIVVNVVPKEDPPLLYTLPW